MTKGAAFEVCLGALLTQNTSWRNVEQAIVNLKRERCNDVNRLLAVSPSRLRRLLRPSGYYREKTKSVRAFARWLRGQGGHFTAWARSRSLVDARAELLTLHGIGPETADSMLLYAGGRPTFVIDVYTRRWCRTFGIRKDGYEALRAYFQDRLPHSVRLFQEFHALIVAWGVHQRTRRRH